MFIIAAMFVVAAWSWSSVPARLPVHWNAAGRIDAYGGKFTALLFLPIVATAVYALLEILSLVRTDRLDAPARRAIGWFKYAFLIVMAGVYAVMSAAARGIVINMNFAVWPLFAIMLIAAGNLMMHGIRSAAARRDMPANGPKT
ncbi:MAG TPA: DUF1648 domain-containing protein [Candidatus Binataceae bacterium]|nr:DUF1648 domain-containing protein [Candidatus Binataceae bacterium]